MTDTAHDEKLKALIVSLGLWVKRNPDAVAGDMAGENLLELVRRIAALEFAAQGEKT
jgi:flagellar biosynthesis regulator FlaF